MSVPTKYRKKPVEIVAMLNDPDNCPEDTTQWIADEGGQAWANDDGSLTIHTLEGDMRADPGDYVIRGVQGEFYPCKPDIFAHTYEPVQDAHTLLDSDGTARCSCGGWEAANVWDRLDGGFEKHINAAEREAHRRDRVTSEQIADQRAKGWPDFHPEDYCHRCGRTNIVWWVDSDLFNEAIQAPHGIDPEWRGIICPQCFVELSPLETSWRLVPSERETFPVPLDVINGRAIEQAAYAIHCTHEEPEAWAALPANIKDGYRVAAHAALLAAWGAPVSEGNPSRSRAHRAQECALLEDEADQLRAELAAEREAHRKAIEGRDLRALTAAVNLWHNGAFPDDTPQDLGLCLGEECGEVQRTILKEGHKANDRRAHVDWPAERYGEVGDVLVCLAKIAAMDGFDLDTCLSDRLAYIIGRYPGANGSQALAALSPTPGEREPTERRWKMWYQSSGEVDLYPVLDSEGRIREPAPEPVPNPPPEPEAVPVPFRALLMCVNRLDLDAMSEDADDEIERSCYQTLALAASDCVKWLAGDLGWRPSSGEQGEVIA